MPRTALKVETFYQFDELSDEAKETARQWWREGEHFWFDPDDTVTVAAILGIEIMDHVINMGQGRAPSIWWSHSFSQGDGASFDANYACAKDAKVKIREYAPEDKTLHAIADDLTDLQARHFGLLIATVHRVTSNYTHSGTMYLDMERCPDERGILPDPDDFTMEMSDHFLKDEAALTEIIRRFGDWIFEQVKADYEWTMSDENVDECIRINEYEFDEEGNRA